MKIIHSGDNNQLRVTTIAPGYTVADVLPTVVSENEPYKIVETLDIDTDFFDAYDFDQILGTKINIDKAKEIQKDKWRAARKPVFEKLDVEFMRALESGDTAKQQEIASKKQQLRDITNTPLLDFLEGIKTNWPAILNY
jgi:hypothetical protein